MSTKLTLYNQSVMIETKDPRLLELIESFVKEQYTTVQDGIGMNAEEKVTVYAGASQTHHAYLLQLNQFKHFFYYLKQNGYELKDPELIDKRDYPHEKIDYKLKPKWKLRDYQVPVYDFIMDNANKETTLIPLDTGAGKTMLSLYSLSKLSNRFAVLVEPRFIDQWSGSIQDIHDSSQDDIYIISGDNESKARNYELIKSLVEIAREEGTIPYKYIIISLAAMRDFIRRWEEDPEETLYLYGTSPMDFFPSIKVHTLLIDEVHISFHAVYRAVMYSNVKHHLAMSATLIPRSPAETRAKNVLYPPDSIYHDTMTKKYIRVFPYHYRVSQEARRKLRWAQSRDGRNGMYMHGIFEGSMTKIPSMRESYFDLINEVAELFYFSEYMEGDKLIVFISLVKTAELLQEYFSEKYPDKKCFKFCQGDSYEEMLSADIIVTTVGKAGTGTDIPGLRVAIQTVSSVAPASNLQTIGRLRPIPDRDVKFIFLVCDDVDKQRRHKQRRIEIFDKKAISFENYRSNSEIEI